MFFWQIGTNTFFLFQNFCKSYKRKATFFLHTICPGTCNVNIVINDSKQTKRSFVVCFQFHTPTATFYNAERMDSVSFFSAWNL